VLQRQFETAELLIARDATAPAEDPLPFRVLILPVPSDEEKQSLGIVVQVPKGSLSGGGPLEMYGYAVSGSGEVQDHFAHFLRLDAEAALANEGSEWQGFSFAGRFDVPAGDYTLKFLAQRPLAGASGRRVFEVKVPKRVASRGFLLPPLFVETSRRWSEIALKTGELQGLPLDMRIDGVSFLPRTDITVKPGRRERIVLIAYDPETANDPAADLDIRSVLSDDSGKLFPTGAIAVEKVLHETGGRRNYVLAFTPENVPPGDYTLRIHIGESTSVLQSYTRLKVLPRDIAANRP